MQRVKELLYLLIRAFKKKLPYFTESGAGGVNLKSKNSRVHAEEVINGLHGVAQGVEEIEVQMRVMIEIGIEEERNHEGKVKSERFKVMVVGERDQGRRARE